MEKPVISRARGLSTVLIGNKKQIHRKHTGIDGNASFTFSEARLSLSKLRTTLPRLYDTSFISVLPAWSAAFQHEIYMTLYIYPRYVCVIPTSSVTAYCRISRFQLPRGETGTR